MTNHSAAVQRSKSGRLIAMSAMFAAMIALTTAYLFHIPMGGNGGYLHFGDAFIYLAACFLPVPYACAAAAIGGGLADFISGAPIWVLPTMLIKPLTAIWFTRKSAKLLCARNLIALVLAGIVSNAGYYIAEAVIAGNWAAALLTRWGGIVQSAGSAVVFVLIAIALDKVDAKNRFTAI